MISHEQMIELQADEHDLIRPTDVLSANEYVLHRMHTFAYASAAKLVAKKTVLDIGCNTGYGSRILAQNATNVFGVDVSAKAIACAKEEPNLPNLQFQVVGLGALPFDASMFDVITCFQVLEHVVDTESFITDLRRVLKSDGIILFTTPNATLRLYPCMKPWNKFHVREFTSNEVHSLLAQYFKHVKLSGLYACEPYYSIEVARVAEARDNMAMQLGMDFPGRRSMRFYARRHLPKGLLAIARKIHGVIVSVFSQKKMNSLLRQQSNHDFFYREENVDGSLDLRAICSDDDHTYTDLSD